MINWRLKVRNDRYASVKIAIAFALSTLPLCSFLAFETLALSFVLAGTFARVDGGS
jgi:hypothetical protein